MRWPRRGGIATMLKLHTSAMRYEPRPTVARPGCAQDQTYCEPCKMSGCRRECSAGRVLGGSPQAPPCHCLGSALVRGACLALSSGTEAADKPDACHEAFTQMPSSDRLRVESYLLACRPRCPSKHVQNLFTGLPAPEPPPSLPAYVPMPAKPPSSFQ